MDFREWCISGLAASGVATIGFHHVNYKFRAAANDEVAPLSPRTTGMRT